jgi:glycosyl hydrolase family 26
MRHARVHDTEPVRAQSQRVVMRPMRRTRLLRPGGNPWPAVVISVIAALVVLNIIIMLLRSDKPPQAQVSKVGGEIPVITPSAAPSFGAQAPPRFGVFVGTDQPELERFEKFAGRKVDDVVDFSGRQTWDEISNPGFLVDHWKGTDKRLIYAVAMLPNTLIPTKEESMRAGARGEFNKHFAKMGKKLVETGHEDAVLRIGWEFNLPTWPWGIKNANTFKKFFRQVVTAVRTVPGQKFKIDWNVNNGYNPYPGPAYYPGDKYVDYVGVDAYDLDSTVYPYPKKCNAGCRLLIQERAWNEVIYGGENGLEYWAFFANKHGKQLSIPEWGLWDPPDQSGGKDNPYYIQQMHDFINFPANNVGYAAYFNFNSEIDGPHSLTETFPISGKKFQKLFAEKK